MELIDVTPKIRKLFLEQVADEYNFFTQKRTLFFCRFDYQNSKLKDTDIFRQINIKEYQFTAQRKYLREICEELGFARQKSGRGASSKGESPWKKAFTWLWTEKFNEWLKLQQNSNIQIPILNDVDWLKVCHTKLENQQQEIRGKASAMKSELDFPPVPLRLEERKNKEKEQPRGDVHQERKPKIYEQNDFLEQVINQNPTGKNKHIAIVGEPGAGKTTVLSAVALYIKQENKELPIFISLGDLKDTESEKYMTLEEYIFQKWLPDAMGLVNYDFCTISDEEIKKIEKHLKKEFYKSGVWLLLDGVDEMGKFSSIQALDKISREIKNWLGEARVVLTCRLNVWDANPLYNDLSGFDTYKTKEFKPEDVDKFIEEWFKSDEDKIQRGDELKAKLRQPGKERIYELVTNPLRLSLLCHIFDKSIHSDLPETKAEFFDLYAEYFYYWKHKLVPHNFNYTLKQELHKALGRLALAGIDSNARFRLKESFAVQNMGQDLFNLACNVGWLTVDRDARTDEAVYAFLHPNFQEYFAALAIYYYHDWHYFLNHVPNHPGEGTYRIFETQWREVILLWFGLVKTFNISDIAHYTKKVELIERLIDFEDNCNKYFQHQALFIATLSIQEFREYHYADDIIMRTIKLAFGYYLNTENYWYNSPECIQKYAKDILIQTDSIKLNQLMQKFIQDIREWEKIFTIFLNNYPISNKSTEKVNTIYANLINNIFKFKIALGEAAIFTASLSNKNTISVYILEDSLTYWLEFYKLSKQDELKHILLYFSINLLYISKLQSITAKNILIEEINNSQSLNYVIEQIKQVFAKEPKLLEQLFCLIINDLHNNYNRIKFTTELIYIIPNCLEVITILIDLIKNDNNYIFREVIAGFSSIKSDNQNIITTLWDKLHEIQHHIKQYLINNNLDEEYINRLSEYTLEIIVSLSEIYKGSIKDIENQIQILYYIPYKPYAIFMARYLLKIQPNTPELIEFITSLLHDNDDEISLCAARELLEIFPNHEPAIYKIISMLDSNFIEKTDLEYLVNNSKAIATLTKLVNTEKKNLKRLGYVEKLLDISINNQTAIDTLFILLNSNDEDTSFASLIFLCGLWTRETLIWYYSNEQIKNTIHHIFNVSKYYNYNNIYKKCLENIVQKHQSTEIVIYIIDLLKKENEVNNTNYDDNYEIFWNCSQNITYPEFYHAWHGELPLQNLETQFTDNHSLLSQLEPTQKTGCIPIINTANLQLSDNEHEIAKLLCTRIWKDSLKLPAKNIPKISDVADLERELLEMTEEVLQKQFLALVFNEIEPNATLINICRKLANAGEIHIALITKQPLDAPLKGFLPNQSTLLSAIQTWISEIA